MDLFFFEDKAHPKGIEKSRAKEDDCMDAEGTLAGASGRVESGTETESNAGITEFTERK